MVLLKYYFSDKVKVKNLLWKALMVLCVIYPVLLCFVIFFVLFISVCFFFFFCFCTYVDFKLILIFPLVCFCFHCIFPSLFCLSLNYLFFVSWFSFSSFHWLISYCQLLSIMCFQTIKCNYQLNKVIYLDQIDYCRQFFVSYGWSRFCEVYCWQF